jgi:hypothetical protein
MWYIYMMEFYSAISDTLEFSGGERVLVLCLHRNQRQELKQRSKEFYLQRSDRKGCTDRHVVGLGIR